MKTKKLYSAVLVIALLALNGCGEKQETQHVSLPSQSLTASSPQTESETQALSKDSISENIIIEETVCEPIMESMDWSSYFDGLNGSAVIYNPGENSYQIYNQELASTQRSPCSTFKIISSLIGLEKGIIVPEDSVRPWSGEIFWNPDWNQDINFEDAFRASCVWYFRQVIDEIGADTIQKELNRLEYGNCDISDWEGKLNTNNSNRALTGFWIESSLKLSPKEQTEVMERIFGNQSGYSKETLEELKNVMLVSEEKETGLSVYGKTGMGKEDPVVYFYEGFLDLYEKEQKKRRGVYYTPMPVVNFMVDAVDYILRSEFGCSNGYLNENVSILDPAAGTGTYLRKIILKMNEEFKRLNGKHLGLNMCAVPYSADCLALSS